MRLHCPGIQYRTTTESPKFSNLISLSITAQVTATNAAQHLSCDTSLLTGGHDSKCLSLIVCRHTGQKVSYTGQVMSLASFLTLSNKANWRAGLQFSHNAFPLSVLEANRHTTPITYLAPAKGSFHESWGLDKNENSNMTAASPTTHCRVPSSAAQNVGPHGILCSRIKGQPGND